MTDLKRNLICLRFRSDFFMCNTRAYLKTQKSCII